MVLLQVLEIHLAADGLVVCVCPDLFASAIEGYAGGCSRAELAETRGHGTVIREPGPQRALQKRTCLESAEALGIEPQLEFFHVLHTVGYEAEQSTETCYTFRETSDN